MFKNFKIFIAYNNLSIYILHFQIIFIILYNTILSKKKQDGKNI